MSKKKKITVSHFLNKRIKPVKNKKGENTFPVYTRIIFERVKTEFKAEFARGFFQNLYYTPGEFDALKDDPDSLVNEEEYHYREIVRHFFEQHGINIITVDSPKEVFEEFSQDLETLITEELNIHLLNIIAEAGFFKIPFDASFRFYPGTSFVDQFEFLQKISNEEFHKKVLSQLEPYYLELLSREKKSWSTLLFIDWIVTNETQFKQFPALNEFLSRILLNATRRLLKKARK